MSKKEKNVYKDTLNLPKTDFPMRANLVQREPDRLAGWEKADIYGAVRRKRQAEKAPRFIFHDGPPFANGDAHMGTSLNKLLKDFIVKSRTMSGFEAPFVPGWDCHGLPIEFKVVQEAQGLEPAEIRRRSEAYARKFVNIQRDTFKRLGILADWENPYLTLAPTYEADIMRAFATLVEKDMVYQSKKPVSWSYGAQTALAEAEVEFKDKKSPAVYVRFELEGDDLGPGTSMVIWTTTPWTLPANLAVAVHPEFHYRVGSFRHEDRREFRLVLAEDLIEHFTTETGFQPSEATPVEKKKGKDFEGLIARHPFLDRSSKVITAGFVTADTGTGQVHIAPGHGQDDYVAGRQNDLEILSPVNDEGCYTEEVGVPDLVGLHVFKANPRVIEILEAQGALLANLPHTHSYPHCWRSKTPIIFRSVEQFFIRIDAIREGALAEIDRVEWVPHWGRNRIYGTVEARPDWCISRQRTWGVPVPAFFDPEGKVILDPAIVRKVADIVEEGGTNLWFEWDDATWAEKLGLPEGSKCCKDTLDVWIDSGSSHVAVLDRHPELEAPADVYIEATDQHRGWFQSSLMMSMAVREAAPYKKVITHGFVIDNSTGEKISKSGDKPINAKFFYEKYGADNLRLWAASVDYTNEVPFSIELFEQVVDAYRRIRNTLRILLANIEGFDPEKDRVAPDDMTLIDRWILERLHQVTDQCQQAYDQFEFRKVYNELNQFCAVDLSSLYIDITKDRMYCDAVDSPRRRSTQTAMVAVLDHLTRLLAPILSFTADEAWEFAGHPESVHLERFPEPDPDFAGTSAIDTVNELLQHRAVIQKEVEEARQAKTIARNDEAVVALKAPEGALIHGLASDPSALREFFIVSDLQLEVGDAVEASVRRTDAPKCPRCWRHDDTIGLAHDELCQRCAEVVAASN
ncbi:MAG: isoleucine--tRNA ligase [Verrucomicrobiota bacterium]